MRATPAGPSLPRVVVDSQAFTSRSDEQSDLQTTTRVRYKPGDWIGGRYEVQAIFGGPGKSGMGVVYKCFDRWDERLCALKSFQDKRACNVAISEVFRREAECWIALGHHPHVVAALTIRKPDGRLYLVLEYIEPDAKGRNCLGHYLKGEPLPIGSVLNWAIQMCWGMEHAARNGIRCHRDIKPDNLLIDQDGRLKISDFGLAKSLDGLNTAPGNADRTAVAHELSLITTEDGITCGSPPWMAPEQFGRAKNADVRNDVYAFGVVFFQMISGGPLPFRGSNIQQYAQLHRCAPVPSLDSPLGAVVDRCMAKHPEDRYQDFTGLRHDLEGHATDLNVFVPKYQPLSETAERLKDWASSLCYLGRYEEAFTFAERAVQKDPQHVASWINHSLCALARDDPVTARDSAQRAIQLSSDNPLAWNNLACAYSSLKQWKEAFEAIRQAIHLDADFLDGWNTLGGLYHRTAKSRRDFQRAVESYQNAVHLDPFFYDGWMNLADSYCGVEQAQEALRCYERAAEIDPTSAASVERRDAMRTALNSG
ncbi:MAG: protein kinase domain-containing protein [Planctomycetota bacterium]